MKTNSVLTEIGPKTSVHYCILYYNFTEGLIVLAYFTKFAKNCILKCDNVDLKLLDLIYFIISDETDLCLKHRQ